MTSPTPLGWYFDHRTEPFIWEVAEQVPRRSTVIVPGARVQDGEPSVVLADRLAGAVELLGAGRVDRVLLSGGPGEVPIMDRWVRERGIHPDQIDRDPGGLRTLLTMERAASHFGITGAVVSTNRFHLARSVWLARSVGIDALGLAADRQIYGKRRRDEAREVIAQGRALVDLTLRRISKVIPCRGGLD